MSEEEIDQDKTVSKIAPLRSKRSKSAKGCSSSARDDSPEPSISRKKRRENQPVNQMRSWSSKELSDLYTLLKQFGTSEVNLEFMSASGLNRRYEEIRDKIQEIRQLANEARMDRINRLKQKYMEIGIGGIDDILQKLPLDVVNKKIHTQWNTATLAMTSQFRGYNHCCSRNAIYDAISELPSDKHHRTLVSKSPMTKNENVRCDLDFGKIRQFLSSTALQSTAVCDLNSLESSVVLQILDDLWLEAQHSTDLKEKAILRGLLSTLKEKSTRDNLHIYPDFPCEELSTTRLYMDPLRTRNWGVPKGARQITKEDVDVRRPDGDLDFYDDDHDRNIPVVQIDPSEVNSAKYPPVPFAGMHALKETTIEGSSSQLPFSTQGESSYREEEHDLKEFF